MNKYPKQTETGLWRWVLPDHMPETARQSYELPKRIFDRLKSREKFPWLFQTPEEALKALELASQ